MAAAAASAQPLVEFVPFLSIKVQDVPDETYYTDMSELFSNFQRELATFKESVSLKGTCIDLFVSYFFRQTQVRLVPENMDLLNTIVSCFNELLQAIIERDMDRIQLFIDRAVPIIQANVGGGNRLLSSPYTDIADYQSNLNILLKECIKSEQNKNTAVGLYPILQGKQVQPVSVHIPGSRPIVPTDVSHFSQPLADQQERDFVVVDVPRVSQKRTPAQTLVKNVSTIGNVVKDTVFSWFSRKGIRSRRNKKNKKKRMHTKRR
jgi:hypothetical protein